jgi:hypothetical protein
MRDAFPKSTQEIPMQWLFVAGGFPSYIIILFGLIAVASAIGFAVRPDYRKLPHLGSLCAAVLLSTLCGVAADLIAVSRYVEAHGETLGAQLGEVLVIGVGESLAPIVLGFSLLSIVALVAAIGFRRLAR